VSERLQKLLAASGYGSRREIERWIRAGRVMLDGRTATLGQRADVDADIRLDGRALSLTGPVVAGPSLPPAAPGALPAAPRREVLLYHKPLGEVTTRSDPQDRPTVFARLPPPRSGRWIVVGRLDVNTTGLLLFTNDGALAHRLMHPSSRIEREYLVRLRGHPDAASLARLRAGVTLEDGPARFDRIEPSQPSERREAAHGWVRVVLGEGRKRGVRRLWQAVGFEVSRLMRLRYGAVSLPAELAPGRWMLLDEVAAEAL
jgi:23S rRNA pseudouridine2605 synthase